MEFERRSRELKRSSRRMEQSEKLSMKVELEYGAQEEVKIEFKRM
jgi:hypothetical protein